MYVCMYVCIITPSPYDTTIYTVCIINPATSKLVSCTAKQNALHLQRELASCDTLIGKGGRGSEPVEQSLIHWCVLCMLYKG